MMEANIKTIDGHSSSDTPRALVTGGAGFLGSHVCERLLREGFGVICLDNLLTGRQKNIEGMMAESGFVFVSGNVTEHIRIEGRLDYVLHLASPASPKDYDAHPIHTLKVGALGTHNTLGLARAKGATFLLASSSEVYGDPKVNPQPETYWGHVNPVGSRSVYDEAKRYAEALTIAYNRVHGVDTRIGRIFNCFGPRMRLEDGRALPAFIGQALQNEPITVFGDGQQTRSFCYVDDLVDGLFRLLVFKPTVPTKGSELVVNVGNPEEVTVLDMARRVIKISGSRSQIEFGPLPEDDPKVRCPDVSKASDLLDWTPRTSVQDGLRRTIRYFENELQIAGMGIEP